MDKLKIKHNHKLTDILKVCIFSIVMMAPLFAILTECLYIICNKSAPTNYATGNPELVFYNAVEHLTTQNLFTWTENTGIYTTINTMFVGLEMPNNNALAIMLTYWMICMLIYLVIDIIVALITKMTHLFNE